MINHWDGRWLRRLETEQDNLRAALQWAVAHDTAMALGFVSALLPFWFFRGDFTEGRTWAERALALPGGAPASARLACQVVAVAFARILGDTARASELIAEGMELAQLGDDRLILAKLSFERGSLNEDQGAHAVARSAYEDARELFQSLDEPFWRAATDESLAACLSVLGHRDAAEAMIALAVAQWQELGHPWGIASALRTAGEIAERHGDRRRAAASLRESLAFHWTHGHRWNVMWRLEDLAALPGTDPRLAAQMLGAAGTLADALHTPLDPVGQQRHDETARRLCAALGETSFAAALAAGAAMPLADAVAGALAPPVDSAAASDPWAILGLTRREGEILRLIAEGKSNRQIGDNLYISSRTVATHITAILAKLDVPSCRTAAAAAAHRLGLT